MAKFIVIDGLDGSGKATQTELVIKNLHNMGYNVHKLSFPNYESKSSTLVKMYLSGELGTDMSSLNPYMCSSLYAVDRFVQFQQEYNKFFEEDDNTVIVSDRYISANIVHQGGKIDDTDERHRLIRWVYEYECGLCGLPIEDMTILLTVPPEISAELITKRYEGNENKKDIHERNLDYLKDCYNRLTDTVNFINSMERIELVKWNTKCVSKVGNREQNNKVRWENINCCNTEKVEIKTIDEINKQIMKVINQLL